MHAGGARYWWFAQRLILPKEKVGNDEETEKETDTIFGVEMVFEDGTPVLRTTVRN